MVQRSEPLREMSLVVAVRRPCYNRPYVVDIRGERKRVKKVSFMRRSLIVGLVFVSFFLGCGLIPGGSEELAHAEKIGPVPSKVAVFVTSWCPYCKAVERFLKENQVKYTRYDIENDPKGSKLYYQLGGGGVPVVIVGTRVMRGYDEDELSSMLQESKRDEKKSEVGSKL